MRFTTTVEIGIDRDDIDETRALKMLARWHGPDSAHVRDDKGRREHRGKRALNTLLDRSPIMDRQLAPLAAYCDELEAWAITERDEFRAMLDALPDDGDGLVADPRVMCEAIIAARVECIADVAEFRRVVIEPALAGIAARIVIVGV